MLLPLTKDEQIITLSSKIRSKNKSTMQVFNKIAKHYREYKRENLRKSGEGQIVYLLDPEATDWTKTFAEKFKYFVDPQITFESVTTCSDCTENYPIALLSIRRTDRPSEDIESILEHLKEEYYERTVLIYIHVRHNKSLLPRIPTKVKTSEFGKTLCDILDFGLVNNSIEACFCGDKLDSKEVFDKFVLEQKHDDSTRI